MIKNLDYLFSKANLLWVFIFVFGCSLLFICGLNKIFPGNWKHVESLLLLASTFIALCTTGMTYVLRSVNTFYRKADAVEAKARVADTIEELKSIHEGELKPLYKDAGFKQQGDRLRQIHYYMEGKYNALLKIKQNLSGNNS